jgi:hypothetical protein
LVREVFLNIRYPLIFLTGALVGGISTYLLIATPEIESPQGETTSITKTEDKILPESPVAPAGEVIDVPKYPEHENDQLADENTMNDIDDAIAEDENTTQVEKFERSIASEEEAPAVSDEASLVEDPRVEEIESTPESEQGIE